MSGSVCEVSVVVAVYNREMLLDRCLDSLVFQNFDRPYEILLIDDQSSDGSWKVMSDWQRRFPGKVRIFRNPVKGVSQAKNLGVSNACGRYVTFVDSDDYLTYGALTRLYEPIDGGENPDVVISPIWRISGERKTVLGGLGQTGDLREELLSGNFFFLVGKLFRRELFERFGPLPSLGISEDVSWVFPVLSQVERLSYVRFSTYYYEFSSNSVSLADENDALAGDAARATWLIVERTAPQYRHLALRYATHRAVNYLADKFPHHQEEILRPVESFYPELRELAASGRLPDELLSRVRAVLTDARFPQKELPPVVFTENDLIEYAPAEMPACVRSALAEGCMDFVRGWRAVRMLVERGGVFMHSDCVRTGSCSPLSSYETVFACDATERVFSEKVFGCRRGARVMRAVLASYETPSTARTDISLADRFRMVAVGMADVPLLSIRVTHEQTGLAVFPVETFIANPCNEADVPVISYDGTRMRPDMTTVDVCIFQATLRRRIVRDAEQIRRLKSELNAVKAKFDDSVGLQRQTLAQLRAEVNALRRSESYRLGLFLTWPLRLIWRWMRCRRIQRG